MCMHTNKTMQAEGLTVELGHLVAELEGAEHGLELWLVDAGQEPPVGVHVGLAELSIEHLQQSTQVKKIEISSIIYLLIYSVLHVFMQPPVYRGICQVFKTDRIPESVVNYHRNHFSRRLIPRGVDL